MKDLSPMQIERLVWMLTLTQAPLSLLAEDDPERNYIYDRIVHTHFQINGRRFVAYIGAPTDAKATRWFDAYQTQGIDSFLQLIEEEYPDRLRVKHCRDTNVCGAAYWDGLFTLMDQDLLVLHFQRLHRSMQLDWVPALCVNNVFLPAADSEIIEPHELPDVVGLLEQFGPYGTYAWAGLKRDQQPRDSYRTLNYIDAHTWWQSQLMLEGSHVG